MAGLPTAKDLHRLDVVRAKTDAEAAAVLVHSARVLRDDRTAHLTWVTGDRELELAPVNAIGGHWR